MAKQSPCNECPKAHNQCRFKACHKWGLWFREEWSGIRRAAAEIKNKAEADASVDAGDEPQRTKTQNASKHTIKNKRA